MKQAYRLEVVRTKIAEPTATMHSPGVVGRRYAYLQKFDRERVIRLDLDNKNRVIGEETVAIGIGEAATMSPREVFRGALLNGATRVIVLHNHPSGDPAPSAEDRKIARTLRAAGRLLAIRVLDFVIIGEDGRYWSASVSDEEVEDGAVPNAAEE
jgi:DNA repair protein RadC